MDLCVRYRRQTLGMELKVWRDGEPDPLSDGLAQLDDSLAGLSLPTGWSSSTTKWPPSDTSAHHVHNRRIAFWPDDHGGARLIGDSRRPRRARAHHGRRRGDPDWPRPAGNASPWWCGSVA